MEIGDIWETKGKMVSSQQLLKPKYATFKTNEYNNYANKD